MPKKDNTHDYFSCFQKDRLEKLERWQEKLEKKGDELVKAINKQNAILIKLETTLDLFMKQNDDNKEDNNKDVNNSWWYIIITGVAVYLITHLIDII